MDKDRDDMAVSPVIAVILLVAITLVLAASAFVWFTSFGGTEQAGSFPQLVLQDAGAACGVGATDPLFTILHRGGPPLVFSQHRFNVFEGDTNHGPTIDWGGPAPGELPTAPFYVGTSLSARETTDICSAGSESFLQLQVLRQTSRGFIIVHEQTVHVR